MGLSKFFYILNAHITIYLDSKKDFLFLGPLSRIFHPSLTRMEPYRNQGHKVLRHLSQVEAGASAGMSWGTQIEKMRNTDAT